RILLGAGLGIVVVAFGIQRGRVGVDRPGDPRDAGDAWLGAAGVVEEEQVADLHAAHEVACLIVAHPIPARPAELLQVSDGQFVGFRFHQPIRHELCSCLPVFAPGLKWPARADYRLTSKSVWPFTASWRWMVQARRRRKKANNNTATGNASWYCRKGEHLDETQARSVVGSGHSVQPGDGYHRLHRGSLGSSGHDADGQPGPVMTSR